MLGYTARRPAPLPGISLQQTDGNLFMAKPFKIFLIVFGVLLALLVGAALALPLILDPNNYKDKITVAVQENTGRELTIGGDIDLSVFPWLGVSLSDLTLGNAEGFGPQPFAQLQAMDVRVKILPLLLDRRVEIGKVMVNGLALNLARNAEGRANWDDLAKAGDKKKEAEPTAADQPAPPVALSVGGLDIQQVALSFDDRQANKTYQLKDLSLVTGPVTLEDPIDLVLQFTASASEPQVSADIRLAAQLAQDAKAQRYEARGIDLAVKASGAAVPAGQQSLRFTGDLSFDQKPGDLTVADAALEVAGVTLKAALTGKGLTGATPRISGKLAAQPFNPREVAKQLQVTLPPTSDASALSQVSFSGDLDSDLKSARIDNLALALDQTRGTGFLHLTDLAAQAVSFNLQLDTLDADRYLAPPAPETGTPAEGSGDFRKTELPIGLLDQFDARGTLAIGQLTLKKQSLSDVVLKLEAPKGKVKTQQLDAKLFGGTLSQAARIQPGPKPTYTMTAAMSGIQAAPILQAFAGKAWLSGIGDFKIDVASGGVTVDDLIKGLSGSVSSSLVQGAVEGFNLRHRVDQARALYNNEPPPADAPKKTEFSDLKGVGTLRNGVLTTNTLSASGAGYQLSGDGSIDLAGMTIDYTLKPTYTGDAGVKELAGLVVPVKISGNLLKPSIKVDLAGALKNKVKAEVKQELRKQEEKVKEKAVEKIGDFFRKRSAPKAEPPAPKPAEPAAEPAAPPPSDPSPGT